LILTFASKSLRDHCESPEDADPPFPQETIDSLKHRLADLEAARSVSDLLAGNPRRSPNADCYLLDVGSSRYLQFRANEQKPRLRQDGTTDWNKVHRIQITCIGHVDD